MTTRLLLVDDHAVVRSGLKMLFENERDMEIVGEAESASGALELAMQVKPNVILMDIGLPDMSGIDATREIKKHLPDTAIVALTIHED
ncbi:MAG: response regulator transcription factor, partial [Anaerolineales bacterium]|nr:response regulator transcription factor [Anaerolineales bacterium]